MDTAKKSLRNYLERSLSGLFLVDEPLSNHVTYRIGGPADFFVYPQNSEQLVTLISNCKSRDIDFLLIGGGSNLLVSDSGYRGVVINMSRASSEIRREGNLIKVNSGVFLKDLIVFCENLELGGLQYLSGIPGTVGGALKMNAGTHKTEICEYVQDVEVLDCDLRKIKLARKDIDFGYRSAPQLKQKIILNCTLKLRYTEKSVLNKTRILQLQNRARKQPLEFSSCGSVFKRPKNHYVGAMVEELGLKGRSCGDAVVSEKHGGFIVNLGSARAKDVFFLINLIKDRVDKQFGIILEEEVKYIGF